MKIPKRLYFIPDTFSWGDFGHVYTDKASAESALKGFKKQAEDDASDPIHEVKSIEVFKRINNEL